MCKYVFARLKKYQLRLAFFEQCIIDYSYLYNRSMCDNYHKITLKMLQNLKEIKAKKAIKDFVEYEEWMVCIAK